MRHFYLARLNRPAKCCGGGHETLVNLLGSLGIDIIPTLWFQCAAINTVFVIMLYQLSNPLFLFVLNVCTRILILLLLLESAG